MLRQGKWLRRGGKEGGREGGICSCGSDEAGGDLFEVGERERTTTTACSRGGRSLQGPIRVPAPLSPRLPLRSVSAAGIPKPGGDGQQGQIGAEGEPAQRGERERAKQARGAVYSILPSPIQPGDVRAGPSWVSDRGQRGRGTIAGCVRACSLPAERRQLALMHLISLLLLLRAR